MDVGQTVCVNNEQRYHNKMKRIPLLPHIMNLPSRPLYLHHSHRANQIAHLYCMPYPTLPEGGVCKSFMVQK